MAKNVSHFAPPPQALMGTVASALCWQCTNTGFYTETPLDVVYGVATCVNLLQNRKQWQLISATGGPMVLGYARVSKGEEQDTRMQETACRAAGVERRRTEHTSGGRWDRPALHRLLNQLRPGDVVVVWIILSMGTA